MKSFSDSKLGVNAVSWAPAGAPGSTSPTGAVVKRVVTATCDNTLSVWRCDESAAGGGGGPADAGGFGGAPPGAGGGSGEWVKEHTLARHSDWVRDAAWAPSAGLPYNVIASCSEDRTVVIWSQEAAGAPWAPLLLHAFDAPVWRVSWSVTGNVLAVSSGEHKVTLWKEGVDRRWVQVSSVVDGVRA